MSFDYLILTYYYPSFKFASVHSNGVGIAQIFDLLP